MQNSFCRNISSACFINGFKSSKINFFAVNTYSRGKVISVFKNPHNSSGLIAFLCFPLILCIFCFCNISQIFKSVIGSIPIYVVNLVLRPITGHVQPSKSMAAVWLAINRRCKISLRRHAPRNTSFRDSRLFQFSRKNSCFWVVVKDLLKAGLGEHPRTLTQS